MKKIILLFFVSLSFTSFSKIETLKAPQKNYDSIFLKPKKNKLIETLKITALSTTAAVIFGISHDLITTQINFDYFSSDITHHGPVTREYFPGVYKSKSPVLYAFLWGTIATWWVGVPLGLGLSGASLLGDKEPVYWDELVLPVTKLIATNLAISCLAGLYTYATTEDRMATYNTVDKNRNLQYKPYTTNERTFKTVATMHNAAYLSAVAVGTFLIYKTYAGRKVSQDFVPTLSFVPVQGSSSLTSMSPALTWNFKF